MAVPTQSNYTEIDEEEWPPRGLPDFRYRGPEAAAIEERGLVPIKISAASLRLRFDGCDYDFIQNVCHAACCQPKNFSYICSTVHPSERAGIESAGEHVRRNLLVLNDDKTCPFQTADYLCRAHQLGVKSFDCHTSPLILNPNGTMVVANWFKSLPCFKAGRNLPLYQCYPAALGMIMGDDQRDALVAHLDDGGGDIIVGIPQLAHQKMCLERHAVGWAIEQMHHDRDEHETAERTRIATKKEERRLKREHEERALEERRAARAAKRQLPVLQVAEIEA